MQANCRYIVVKGQGLAIAVDVLHAAGLCPPPWNTSPVAVYLNAAVCEHFSMDKLTSCHDS